MAWNSVVVKCFPCEISVTWDIDGLSMGLPETLLAHRRFLLPAALFSSIKSRPTAAS
jgi:hypothetical protein